MANILSERIEIMFTDKPTESGVYRYGVLINGVIVFVGNTYLEGNINPIIDITDVLKNYVDVNKPPFSTTPEISNILKSVEVKLYLGDIQSSQMVDVLMLYSNPFFNTRVNTPILDDYLTPTIGTMPMLQGWDYLGRKGYLLPTYPTIASDVFTFDMVCGYQKMPFMNGFYVNYKSGLKDQPINVRVDNGGGVYQYSIPLSGLLTGNVCDLASMDILIFSPIQPGVRYTYKIANFDSKSRFFLKWKDRYGMPQVQPFGGNYRYSEDIDRNTIINYKNIKKVIDISNTPKWLLNTKWIKEDLYPFYESIFVSPYLQLYDVVEDKLYNVILKNTEYQEKTFTNQNKQMFNLQLEVELDTTEYMIY
jgi:hypothetical protein